MPAAVPPRSRRPAARAAEAAEAVGRGALADTPRVPFEGRVRWDRVGRIALLALLAVVLLLYVAPLSHWITQSRAAEVQRTELRALEREHDRLAARARDLERPETLEREARRLGMVRRGERAFVIETAPASR